MLPLLAHRCKGTSKLFGQFQEQASQDARDVLVGKPKGASGQHGQAMSAADISALIRTAAAYVLGASVADDEPLSGAGLDSLGERTLPQPVSSMV